MTYSQLNKGQKLGLSLNHSISETSQIGQLFSNVSVGYSYLHDKWSTHPFIKIMVTVDDVMKDVKQRALATFHSPPHYFENAT